MSSFMLGGMLLANSDCRIPKRNIGAFALGDGTGGLALLGNAQNSVAAYLSLYDHLRNSSLSSFDSRIQYGTDAAALRRHGLVHLRTRDTDGSAGQGIRQNIQVDDSRGV